ncbi:MAG: HIG1 domain-containing protein [Rhodospirillales bacterium]
MLIIGLGGFAGGGNFNKKYGNKLMQMRVLLQGVAIGLIVILIVATSS